MTRGSAIWAVALAALAFSGSSRAHDAWIDVSGPRYEVIYGHGGKIEPYAAAKAMQLVALDKEGRLIAAAVETSAAGVSLVPTSAASLLLVDFDNGYWTKTASGWKNVPRTAARDATESSHSLKFGKTVLAWGPVASKPVGQRLEIVPLSAQPPRAGQRLLVQVLYEGQPLAGASIGSGGHDHHASTTDGAGKASVVVRKGRQMIVASHSRALDRPEAERESLAANLVFTAR
jgi:nickel transport protein